MLFRILLWVGAGLMLAAQTFSTNLITTLAGTDPQLARDATALTTALPPGAWGKPAIDAAGNIYFSLTAQNVVMRLTPAGRMEAYAGNGFARFGGDGGLAGQSNLNGPRDVAVDSRGNLYIADTGNKRVRRVAPNRVIDTYAGGGTVVPTPGGVKLSEASLTNLNGIAVDGADNLYLAIDPYSIARIDAGASQIRLYAGTPGRPGAPASGPVSGAQFRAISALAADKGGNLYIADAGAISIIRIVPAGRMEVLTTRSATFGVPVDVAADSAGTVYFSQNASPVIWRLQNNSVDIFAGSAEREGYTPSGTARDRALFGDELRLGLDPQGAILVGDNRNSRLRRVSSVVDTIAGADLVYSGEGGPATAAVFYAPGYVAQARIGAYYFTDSASRLVFSIDPKGVIRRFAGSGILNATYVDGAPLLEGNFGSPTGIAVDSSGNVYVADEDCAIRRLGTDGSMRLYAGVPDRCGATPDGTALKDARFGRLRGLTLDSAGNLYIADVTNHKVWRVGADGVIRTFAGTGSPGTSTTSLPAAQTPLNTPLAVAVASDGAVYISDSMNNRVVRVGTEGRSTTYVGIGQRASTGDGGPASSAAVNQPAGLAIDTAGNLYIAEFGGNRVRRVNSSGVINAYAGTGIPGSRGDGGYAVAAQLSSPFGLLLNSAGQLVIADRDNGRLRLVLNGPPAVRIPTTPVSISLVPGDFLTRGTLDLPSPLAGLGFETSVRYPGTVTNWLTVFPPRGTLPGSIAYEVNSAGLPAGDYSAQIVITVPTATPRETLIPVTIKVPPPPTAPYLKLGSPRLTMSAVRGSTAQQAVAVLNPGASPITIRGAAVRSAFLSVRPPELTIAPGQTGTFLVIAYASTVAPGTYPGTISFDGGALSSTVPVSFSVSPVRPRLTVSQTGLSIRAVAGGPAPQPQTLYAAGANRLAVRVSPLPNSDWLTASASGTQVTVTANPQGLSAGDYYGRVEIFDESAPTVRQFAMVLLQVLPEGSDPGPEVTPNALFFTATTGADASAQVANLVLPTAKSLGFTASASTFDGLSWLQVSPAGGSVIGGAPARVIVQPDLSSLSPGAYRGTVTLTLEDGRTRQISVLAVVSPSASLSSKAPDREASSCGSPDLFAQALSPSPNFRVTVGEPLRLAVRVVDGCGNFHQPEGGGSASVAVIGVGSQVVNLSHIGSGVWEGTTTPNTVQNAATLTYLGIFSRGATFQAGADKVNGSVVTAPRPVVFNDSLTDAASFQFGVPVAPGTLVSLFGANLNPANAVPSTLPLPERLGDVEVRLNDRPIPLLYAGPSQVNAQIPYTLDPDTEYQLEIRRGTAIATPQPLVISQARPGIFTLDQTGQGQGHIYRAFPNGSAQLADPANAATTGEVLVIYCNGLGLTNPSVTAGAAAPTSPLAVTANPVTLTIGGQNASIAYTGLTPGFAGLYQINATVPPGVTPGPLVPVVISVAGQASVPVTMGIR